MPRIGEPVWLTMMSGTPEKNQLCHRFMKEFTFLMENAAKNQYGGFEFLNAYMFYANV